MRATDGSETYNHPGTRRNRGYGTVTTATAPDSGPVREFLTIPSTRRRTIVRDGWTVK